MKTPEEPQPNEVLELSLRVSDHQSIDWSMAQSSDPKTEATLAQLREIAKIAEQHRSDQTGNPESDELIAGEWGDLRLIEKLAEGGFGEVWRARDPALQRDVALKLSRAGDARSVTRWLEEARVLARVHHPNVITVHGADRRGERTGIWMELVEGLTLEELLARVGPLSAAEAALVGIELCSALGAVHAAGLVHGDVKTRNIMRAGSSGDPRRAGQILLMDFGSAQANDSGGSSHTPLYAAPELLDGGAPSRASDIYALGVVLFRLTTGRFPVEADSIEALREKLRTGHPFSLREARPLFPLSFVRVIETALAPDPSLRFADAASMESALVASVDLTTRIERRRPRLWSLALAAFCGIAVGVASLWVAQNLSDWTRRPFRVAMRGVAVEAALTFSHFGERTNDGFGAPMCSAGDVDGDGFEDYLVASIQIGEVGGAVTIFRGSPGGSPEPWLLLRGENPNEAFGSSVSGGDLNGDGFDDIVIGAPHASNIHSTAGRVYVWFGGPGLDTTVDLRIEGESENQSLGYDLDCAGDLNGDGFADLCVGAPLDERAGFPTGRALVFLGGKDFDAQPDLDLTSAASYSQYGVGVSTANLNGDAFADLIVSANWENTDSPLAGRVYIYLGSAQLRDTPDLIVRGPFENALLGAATPLGDLNGDGYDDLGVQSFRDHSAGRLRLGILMGGERPDSKIDWVIDGPDSDDGFASSFGPAGDVNGDGQDDFFVGAPSSDEAVRNAGAVYIYFGGVEMDGVADLKYLGRGTWDLFGSAAVPVPDRDGDDCGGLLIGSRWASDAARRAGRIDLYEFRN